MFVMKITGCAAAAVMAAFLPIGSTQAAMTPVIHFGTPNFHHVDCAVVSTSVRLERAWSAPMIGRHPAIDRRIA
jgi:hypothetical protein